jgi:POT family proton-dependent oligopeptide transporter
MATANAQAAIPASLDRTFFGHPRGLSTLFFTEMWERFSYYGMRGFLILYMTAAADVGGMGLPAGTAAPIYGLYTAMVYLMSLPGGWIADRLIGQRQAVLIGGTLIACGHYSLAIPVAPAFYTGLVLIVLGTGLLKPNISVMVGQLYSTEDARRDAGFSLFYMGINLGAFFGPLVTGFLAQDEGFRGWLAGHGLNPNNAWHWGFGAAGIGMTLGLLQYAAGGRALGEAGLHVQGGKTPAERSRLARRVSLSIGAGVLALLLVGIGMGTGRLPIDASRVNTAAGYLQVIIAVPFFAWLVLDRRWTRDERRRLYAIVVFFVAAAVFWSVYEQAGSTLNLFADRNTRTEVLGREFPSSWFQSLNPLLIFVLAPLFAWIWARLGSRQPSTPVKFAIGLLGVGIGFVILVPAARQAALGVRVSPGWLTATYIVHTIGELCLSPVGLSAMTKLAPARIVSLMMGVWFLGASVGNYIGGNLAGFYETWPLPSLFAAVGLSGLAAAVLMLLIAGPIKRMMEPRH